LTFKRGAGFISGVLLELVYLLKRFKSLLKGEAYSFVFKSGAFHGLEGSYNFLSEGYSIFLD
jgi:hypothetical protein